MPTLLYRCAAASIALVASSALASAQGIPYSQRVRFEAATVPLDSTTVQLTVEHFETAAPLRALVCFDSPQVVTTITGDSGTVRVSNLRTTNTHVRVVAPGFMETSLIFYPGKPGRSYARVRLVPTPATAATNPSCADGRRGAT